MSDSQPFLSDEKTIDSNETNQISTINSSIMQLNDTNGINDNEQYYNDILYKLIYSELDYAFFICKGCNKHPLLQFDNDFLYNLDKFNCTCDCPKNQYKKISIEEFEKLFGVRYFDEKYYDPLQDKLKCDKKHKFSGFLEVDNRDICIKCMIFKDNSKNEEKYIKFDEYAMYKRIKYLVSIFELYHNKDYNSKDKSEEILNKKEKIKIFITELIENYINFKNHNVYQSLINLETSIKGLEKKSSKDNLFIYNIEINNTNDFRKIIDDKSLINYVTKIDIQRKNINNLKLLSDLKNLNHLDLRNNCIKDIEPLINASFENLEFLNLSTNALGTNKDNIQHLNKLKLKNLKYLNLDLNKITDYGIFIAIGNNKNFRKLEQLYLNFNAFSILNGKKMKKNEFKEYFADVNLDFNSIQMLGLSYGVFDKKTIEYVFPCFELTNVKEINLKYNNLDNYDFLFTKNKCQWCRQLEKDIRENKKPKVEKIHLIAGNYKIKEILDDQYSKLKYHDEIRFLKSYIV